jgi:hypothetical protein
LGDITEYKKLLLETIIREATKEVKRKYTVNFKPIFIECEPLSELVIKAFIHKCIAVSVMTVSRQGKKDGIATKDFMDELLKTAKAFFDKIDLDVLYKAIKQNILYEKTKKRKGMTIDNDGGVKAIINSFLEAEKTE